MAPNSKGDPAVRALGRNKPDRTWYPENFDWYLKWAASIFILISLSLRAAGPELRFYDLVFGTIGVFLWLWVSVIWRDRALIMLNAVSGFLLMSALFKEFV